MTRSAAATAVQETQLTNDDDELHMDYHCMDVCHAFQLCNSPVGVEVATTVAVLTCCATRTASAVSNSDMSSSTIIAATVGRLFSWVIVKKICVRVMALLWAAMKHDAAVGSQRCCSCGVDCCYKDEMKIPQ